MGGVGKREESGNFSGIIRKPGVVENNSQFLAEVAGNTPRLKILLWKFVRNVRNSPKIARKTLLRQWLNSLYDFVFSALVSTNKQNFLKVIRDTQVLCGKKITGWRKRPPLNLLKINHHLFKTSNFGPQFLEWLYTVKLFFIKTDEIWLKLKKQRRFQKFIEIMNELKQIAKKKKSKTTKL